MTSFTFSRPLGLVFLALMAIGHVTMLGLHLAFNPSWYWFLTSYLGGVIPCVGFILLFRRSQLKPMSLTEAASVFIWVLLISLFTGLLVLSPRHPNILTLCNNSFMTAFTGALIAVFILDRMGIWRQSDKPADPDTPPASHLLTLRDALRYTAAPLLTIAFWAAAYWVQPQGVSPYPLLKSIAAITSIFLIFESIRNWGKPRLAQGMLAGLFLVLLLLILFLGISAALLLTGHAP